jgi:hypothetical protein
MFKRPPSHRDCRPGDNGDTPSRDRQREQQRSYRQRAAGWCRHRPSAIRRRVINFLIATHWLTEREAGDWHAIGKAMSAALAESAKHR